MKQSLLILIIIAVSWAIWSDSTRASMMTDRAVDKILEDTKIINLKDAYDVCRKVS